MIRDDALFYQIHQHLGGYDREVEINEGKVEEKVVCGSVQVRTQTNQNNQAQVPPTVATYASGKEKRGHWSSGCCVKPRRTNSLTEESFSEAILPYSISVRMGEIKN